jgi:hypothetical protein
MNETKRSRLPTGLFWLLIYHLMLGSMCLTGIFLFIIESVAGAAEGTPQEVIAIAEIKKLQGEIT